MVHEATGQHLTWTEAKIDSFFRRDTSHVHRL